MYVVIKTKAGWAVQNAKTYHVVIVCPTESQAINIAAKLSK
jgi:hypothetical protein